MVRKLTFGINPKENKTNGPKTIHHLGPLVVIGFAYYPFSHELVTCLRRCRLARWRQALEQYQRRRPPKGEISGSTV